MVGTLDARAVQRPFSVPSLVACVVDQTLPFPMSCGASSMGDLGIGAGLDLVDNPAKVFSNYSTPCWCLSPTFSVSVSDSVVPTAGS